ncbi:MAG: N-acetyltransferase [Frankiales bacterium]|nr:N-acetyltransferase [Frankiales bacterium]
MQIRPFRVEDTADVYDVCVRTADAGGDATGQYSNDDLMPDLFAGPYVLLEPEHAFVVDDGTRVVGYVIGTSDTEGFVRRYRSEWIPLLGSKYVEPAADDASREASLVRLHFRPERMLSPEFAPYPAHLHIDLLPSVQRLGLGRRLIATFLAAMAAEGVPAVHLGMDTANVAARAFYDRLGFTQLPVAGAEGATFLVRRTS